MANFITCMVIAVFSLQMITANQDLRAEWFKITNDLPPMYVPGEYTAITLDLQVKNMGDDPLHTQATPYFTAIAYFTDNVEEENANERSKPTNLTITDPLVNGPFPQTPAVNLTGLTGSITVDKDHCLHYDYLCVQIIPFDSNDEVDNNDFCLHVGVPPPGGVGHLHCTDLVIEDFKITSPETMKFRAEMLEKITASISVKNMGPVDIPMEMVAGAYGIDLFLEGPEASKSLGYVRAQDNAHSLKNVSFNGRDHLTNPSNVVTIDNLELEVTIDKDNCEKYEELCVRLIPSVNTRSKDEDDEDDVDRCLPFHSSILEGGAGMKNCTYVKAKEYDPEDKIISEPDTDPNDGNLATVSIATLVFSLLIAKFL